MTIVQILTDVSAGLGALGVVCSFLQHLPFPAVWVQRFARAATWASNARVSVNARPTDADAGKP